MAGLSFCINETAANSMAQIYRYYAEAADHQIANSIVSFIEQQFEIIRRKPSRGRIVPEIANVRRLFARKASWTNGYHIFYQHSAHEIVILDILHASRDWQSLIHRLKD